jgi:hypothetical protein
MKSSAFPKGLFLISSGALLLIFWILFAVFLPMTEPYINWVMDPDWLWINSIGFTGSLLGLFAMNELRSKADTSDKLASLGYFFSIFGVIILTSLLFFEAFILKGIALQSPTLVDLDGSFYQYWPFKSIGLAGGLSLSLGAFLLGWRLYSKASFRKWKVIVFMISCPLFGIVLMPGNLRLLGVLMYTVAFISMGVELLKTRKE